ncbi:hypothetical protein BDR04DRAFT_1086336 [Suillus decipiens]|nr:hypothetical protein BDR04DRAFT_1086336 [Suillus decipiens]
MLGSGGILRKLELWDELPVHEIQRDPPLVDAFTNLYYTFRSLLLVVYNFPLHLWLLLYILSKIHFTEGG